jgi:pyruvate,water dikinase
VAADRKLVIPLGEPAPEELVGGKATNLSQLIKAGFRVPKGFSITVHAYESFVRDHGLTDAIRMELGRKSLDDMRWEEIWDAALRIRSLFVSLPLSAELCQSIDTALNDLVESRALAVRSSAPGEDAKDRSFAGLHESKTDVIGSEAVQAAIRLVWASLWSDAALLYRRELQLDPARSRMAVIVQEMIEEDRSGVAFGNDPRELGGSRAIVEAVPGPCQLLVDGSLDPDRWEIDRQTRRPTRWQQGERPGEAGGQPLLDAEDLSAVVDALFGIEHAFDWAPDMEWTGRSSALTILQARPITAPQHDPDEKRSWYLTLRPGDARLRALRERVADQLIPQLEAEGHRLAQEDIESLRDAQLAEVIEQRHESLEHWKKIYWDEFIPFAHGVRRLATYYNDAVGPDDPYEFVGLLRDQELLATQRNQAMGALAQQLESHEQLKSEISRMLQATEGPLTLEAVRQKLPGAATEDWLDNLGDVAERFLDIAFGRKRLSVDLRSVLHTVLELVNQGADTRAVPDSGSVAELEQRLLDAVGAERRQEALEVLETGRISWKLRDDDNLLVGRVESQLLRALEVAARRLGEAGRLVGAGSPGPEDLAGILNALRNPSAVLTLRLTEQRERHEGDPSGVGGGETPRQLIGQPASPGLATGSVLCIRDTSDLARFKRGDVLVCDAIQPHITHIVPLASAIVERRGGMLIHGAIIAREFGIPCVNGVRAAAELLNDGDLVTVDGYLGIVTVGPPDFSLELAEPADS